MPKTKRGSPLYQRGIYRLDERAGREQLVITWYDREAKRERTASAGTSDIGLAKRELDRRYLEAEGAKFCPTCGQEVKGAISPTLDEAIADYLILKDGLPSAKAIKARLEHVIDYAEATGQERVLVATINEEWVAKFRQWMQDKPIVSPTGKTRKRAPGTTENSVLQLAAVINAADPRGARFAPAQPTEVNRTPTYRADIDTLARMFAYALASPRRRGLLAFLRFSVLTLARPDAVFDASTAPAARQWDPQSETFNLKNKDKRQTRKFRPTVPIAKQGVAWLNSFKGPVVETNSVRTAWRRMAEEVGLPGDGQAGIKLIRRSMADLMPRFMDVKDWGQIEMYLGHRKMSSITTLYAPSRPDYLLEGKRAIERIIDRIEEKAPGAFYRILTADQGAEAPRKLA